MSMEGGNGNDDISCFKTASIETDEDDETSEERLQRASALSMMNENDCKELVASKGNTRA